MIVEVLLLVVRNNTIRSPAWTLFGMVTEWLDRFPLALLAATKFSDAAGAVVTVTVLVTES